DGNEECRRSSLSKRPRKTACNRRPLVERHPRDRVRRLPEAPEIETDRDVEPTESEVPPSRSPPECDGDGSLTASQVYRRVAQFMADDEDRKESAVDHRRRSVRHGPPPTDRSSVAVGNGCRLIRVINPTLAEMATY